MLLTLLAWNYKFSHDTIQEIALYKMRLFFSEVLESRAWSNLHAGIFQKHFPPDSSGAIVRFTKYTWTCEDTSWNRITGRVDKYRQVSAAVMKKDLHVRVTSRLSNNPENLPDCWERTALESFDKGGTEYFQLTKDIQKQPVYRYIAPLKVGFSCTSCHQNDTYLFKKFSAGISIISPAEPMLTLLAADKRQHLIGFGIVWLLGCSGIVAAMRKLMANNENRIMQEKFVGVMEMAGAAAHELNQPLQVISSCTDIMLASGCRPGKDCANLSGQIKQSVDKLASITRKINRITRYVTTDYVGKTRIIDLEKAAPKLEDSSQKLKSGKSKSDGPSIN